MIPESATPTTTTQTKLIPAGDTPPRWRNSWVHYIPLIGKTLVTMMNAMRYQTTLEQSAEFIAADLESHESQWIGKRVGTIDESK
jgi:hypothetical protein